MKCFYCKDKLPQNSPVDICDRCLFRLDESEYEDYDQDDIQREIEGVLYKSGATPAKFIE